MAGLWVLSLPLAVIFAFVPATDPFSKPLAITITVAGLLWITLDTVLSKVTVDGEAIVFRSPLLSRRLQVAPSSIVRYRPGKEGGDWRIEAEGRTVRVPLQSPWDLHAAMVEFAPTKLGAKRLRPLHLPTTEDFVGLWTLDTDLLVSEALWRMIVCLGFAAAFHAGAAATGPLLALLLFTALRAWGRLDVTGEGLVRRSPFHRIQIGWSEATAIFCENPKGRRSFVVTAPGRGLEIPPHLAKDIDLMRKVFRSLPENTLCVNFDETTFRGYKRRKRTKAEVPGRSEDLLPALTA